MSPHQAAEQIVEPYGFGPNEHAKIVGRITSAIQAASNEEMSRRREYTAGLEAALTATYGELSAVQAVAALAGLPAVTWAGFGSKAKSALSGSTSALDAVVAEAVATITEERDALAAALEKAGKALDNLYVAYEDGTPCYECPDENDGYLGNAFELSDDEEMGVLEALEAVGIETVLRLNSPTSQFNPTAILAARDSRMKAEGRRAGLLEAAAEARARASLDGSLALTAMELEQLAEQAGEVKNVEA